MLLLLLCLRYNWTIAKFKLSQTFILTGCCEELQASVCIHIETACLFLIFTDISPYCDLINCMYSSTFHLFLQNLPNSVTFCRFFAFMIVFRIMEIIGAYKCWQNAHVWVNWSFKDQWEERILMSLVTSDGQTSQRDLIKLADFSIMALCLHFTRKCHNLK